MDYPAYNCLYGSAERRPREYKQLSSIRGDTGIIAPRLVSRKVYSVAELQCTATNGFTYIF